MLDADQHGTAIVVGAALLNALKLVGKDVRKIKVAACGVGKAGIACLDTMVLLGVAPEHIRAADSKGVLYTGRDGGFAPQKRRYVRDTAARTLADIVDGADVFLGCSAGAVLTPETVSTMAEQPIILALANPEPEIRPEEARAVRPDCIVATCLPDYPNQVSNVLCLPYVFRGALDCGATRITDDIAVACANAIAELAREDAVDAVVSAYPGHTLSFGPEYIIPKLFDPRLLAAIVPRVAEAAAMSGVAARPIVNLSAYRDCLAEPQSAT